MISSLKYSVGPIPVCRYQYWGVRALKKLSFPHQHSTLLSKTSRIEYTLFKNHLLTYLPDSWQNQLKYRHTLTDFVDTAYTFFFMKSLVFLVSKTLQASKNFPDYKNFPCTKATALQRFLGLCTEVSRLSKLRSAKSRPHSYRKMLCFLQKFTLTWKMVRTLCGIIFSILTPELIPYWIYQHYLN